MTRTPVHNHLAGNSLENNFSGGPSDPLPVTPAPAWLQAVNDFNSPVDMPGIHVTTLSVMDCLKEASLRNLDFNLVSRASPSPQHLVALLRLTFQIKHHVPGWFELRDFALTYLPTKGHNPEQVMRGLLWVKPLPL